MERNPIRIPLYLIRKVTKEDTADSLRALAFALMIKANFVSSTFKEATATNLMSFFHLKHHTLKQALNKALELGFVEYEYRTDKKGVTHKNLKATPFNYDGYNTVKLRIADTAFGRAMFINTHLKDLYTKYQNSTSYQSINDVMDLLVKVQVLTLMKAHNKALDCVLRQACLKLSENYGEKLYRSAKTFPQYVRLYRMMQNETPYEDTPLNRGYSIDKMLSHFGAYLTRYKLSKLLHEGDQNHDYLFCTLKNVIYYSQDERIMNYSHQRRVNAENLSPIEMVKQCYKAFDDMVATMRKAYKERFMEVDEEGNVINLHDTRGYFAVKRPKRCLAKPMANTYYMRCEDIFVRTCRRHRRVKKNRNGKNQNADPSVKPINADELPF